MSKSFLHLEGVSIKFRDSQIFQNVSLNIERGEVVVIIGESGVGKSTLLRAIAGQCLFEGSIEIQGGPPSGHEKQLTKSRIVLVPQQPYLWDHLTAAQNVALVRQIVLHESILVSMKHAMSYLAKLEVSELADRYPYRLSGGEQQRVSLARGFAAEADLYLLDEITAHLDPRRRENTAACLKAMASEGRTLIIVTHDHEFAQELSKSPYLLTKDGLIPHSQKDANSP